MNLDDLRTLEREARELDYKADVAEHAASVLQGLRVGNAALSEIANPNSERWRYGGEKPAFAALQQSLDGAKEDLLRLAELRLAAQVREHRIKAAQRRAVLHASILPVPGTEKATEAA